MGVMWIDLQAVIETKQSDGGIIWIGSKGPLDLAAAFAAAEAVVQHLASSSCRPSLADDVDDDDSNFQWNTAFLHMHRYTHATRRKMKEEKKYFDGGDPNSPKHITSHTFAKLM